MHIPHRGLTCRRAEEAMERSITIKVAGYVFSLTAASPEHEEVLRKAAGIVNEKIGKLQEKNHTGKSPEELLMLAALTISTGYVMQTREIERMNRELESLHKEIEGYLDNIDKI